MSSAFAANGTNLFFLWLSNIPLCVYVCVCVYGIMSYICF